MNTEKIASKFLGQKVEGKSVYDPSFLVAVPRQENRNYLGYNSTNYPAGFDTWYGYEFTTLLNNGLPINRVIKIVYPSSSDCIVESKSLKLYLNTFSMTMMGDTIEDALMRAETTISADLSMLLNTCVRVGFFKSSKDSMVLFNDYKDLYSIGEEIYNIHIDKYEEDSSLLKVDRTDDEKVYKLMFKSLKSNCRVTHQPDFGDLYIYYKSKKHIDEKSLIKYLCSFRNENHFHEEIVECCFNRLSKMLYPNDMLMVTALYTRRGGIDINPCRNQNIWIDDSDEDFDIKNDILALMNTNVYTRGFDNIKQ